MCQERFVGHSVNPAESFLSDSLFYGFVDSSIRMRTQDDFFQFMIFVEKTSLFFISQYLSCSATMFLSVCGSSGYGIIRFSPVFLSTSLASSVSEEARFSSRWRSIFSVFRGSHFSNDFPPDRKGENSAIAKHYNSNTRKVGKHPDINIRIFT